MAVRGFLNRKEVVDLIFSISKYSHPLNVDVRRFLLCKHGAYTNAVLISLAGSNSTASR
jgi:hypothetical protein